ncbi:MAG TPA: hypothetical protein DEQ47_15355 [Solibacterales bacterium]|nr:hypothetical protein [Bryobacterales bacterium]
MVKLLAVFLLAGACLAQSAEPAKFYKLEFVIKEAEAAKVLSAHSFTMIAATDANNTLRTGARLPVATAAPAQYTYLDVGVSIDCRNVKESAAGLSMYISADVSSVPAESNGTPPVVHQNRWTTGVIVPLQKSTVLFASDDMTTKHQMRLELTATPVR